MVMCRENTEGLYIGKENWVKEGEHAESIAVVTRKASENVIRAAFEYAKNKNRKKITLVHKANILKLTCGLFMEVGEEISKEYPDIEYAALIIANSAVQMLMSCWVYDAIVFARFLV